MHDRNASTPIHGYDLARGMLDLDIVEEHYLQDLGDRITVDGFGLDLCSYLRAQPGQLRLLERRWRLGIRNRNSHQDGVQAASARVVQFAVMT